MTKTGPGSNAYQYRQLLKRPAEGICLWYPSDTAALGDVGYVFEGRFITLFNAFRPPDGLPGLHRPTGPPDLNVANLRNTHLAWVSLTQSGCHIDATVPVDTNLVEVGFSVHSQTGGAAFLVPGGTSRRVETFDSVRDFELYLDHNYAAIVGRYSGHKNLDTLMMLRGTTHTDGYGRGLLQQSSHKVDGALRFSPLGIEMFSLSVGANSSFVGNWLILDEPTCTPITSVPNHRHCIIVKPVIVRKRAKIKRLLSSPLSIFTRDSAHSRSASATQNDFPSRPVGNVYSRVSILRSITCLVQAIHGPSATVSLASSSATSADSMASTASQTVCALEGDDDRSDDSDDFSLVEDHDPRDDFEIILDMVLDSYPDQDMVIVDWDVLHHFWEVRQIRLQASSGAAVDEPLKLNDPARQGYKFEIEPNSGLHDGRVAYLRRISLPDNLGDSCSFRAETPEIPAALQPPECDDTVRVSTDESPWPSTSTIPSALAVSTGTKLPGSPLPTTVTAAPSVDLRPLPPGYLRHRDGRHNTWLYVNCNVNPPKLSRKHPADEQRQQVQTLQQQPVLPRTFANFVQMLSRKPSARSATASSPPVQGRTPDAPQDRDLSDSDALSREVLPSPPQLTSAPGYEIPNPALPHAVAGSSATMTSAPPVQAQPSRVQAPTSPAEAGTTGADTIVNHDGPPEYSWEAGEVVPAPPIPTLPQLAPSAAQSASQVRYNLSSANGRRTRQPPLVVRNRSPDRPEPSDLIRRSTRTHAMVDAIDMRRGPDMSLEKFVIEYRLSAALSVELVRQGFTDPASISAILEEYLPTLGFAMRGQLKDAIYRWRLSS